MICGVVATSISGCGVCSECCAVWDSVHTPQPETLVTITLQNINSILLINFQNCTFSKTLHRLPEDGPIGPKHVGSNIELF